MNLLSVSNEFWVGSIFTIIAFMLLAFIILLIISLTPSFKRMMELYEEDTTKQKPNNANTKKQPSSNQTDDKVKNYTEVI